MRRAQLLFLGVMSFAACDEPAPRPADQFPIAPSELHAAKPSSPGEAVYLKTCIACHAADGNGNDKKTGASFIAADGPLAQSDDVLLTSILDGKTGSIGVMPPHRALLTQDEAKAVLAYVRQRFGAAKR